MKNILKILFILILVSCGKSVETELESKTYSEDVIKFDEEKQNFSEIEGILFYKGNPLTGKVLRNLKITICCDKIKKKEDTEERERLRKMGDILGDDVIDGMYSVIVQEIITYKYGKKEGESNTSFDFGGNIGRISLMEGVYKDGKKNGKWKDYGYHTRHLNGNMMGEKNLVGGEGNYLNGGKVGEWKYYFQPWIDNGELFDTLLY